MSSVGTVLDRVHALVVAQGYARAADAFDFEAQPDTRLDRVYYLRSARVSTEGYLGGACQAERHEFTIYLAQRTRRDAAGAARQLAVDMDLLEADLIADETDESYGYFVVDDGVRAETQPPPHEGDFVVGRFQALLELDRYL